MQTTKHKRWSTLYPALLKGMAKRERITYTAQLARARELRDTLAYYGLPVSEVVELPINTGEFTYPKALYWLVKEIFTQHGFYN